MIDGFEYVGKTKLCSECLGTGDWYEQESELLWLQGNCPVCDGNGVLEGDCGFCVQCEAWTCNKSYGDWLCTSCDITRHTPEQINFPSRYDRQLL